MRRHSDRNRLGRVTLALGALIALALLTLPAPAQAAATGFTWTVSVGGKNISASGGDTVKLAPRADIPIVLTIDNTGLSTIKVHSVRVGGTVIGMSLFAVSTDLGLEALPEKATSTPAELNLSDLDGLATGLIPAEISLISADGSAIDTRTFTADVRGSLNSAYGRFGLAVAAITVVFLIGLFRDIATGRLPYNRWQRGIRFFAPGVGLGLTATFTLSATRILAPQAGAWVPLVLVFAAVAFLLGYFTPSPEEETGTWNGPPAPRSGQRRDISLDPATDGTKVRAEGGIRPRVLRPRGAQPSSGPDR
jgi:hypothetical protein